MRVVTCAAQRASARDTMREPRDKLLHLARRTVHGLIHEHFEIRADHLVTISFCRLIIASGFRMLPNLAEYPWIRGSRASDHHSITPGLRHHGDGIFRRADIAVAHHGNLNGVLNSGNPVPARVAAISL